METEVGPLAGAQAGEAKLGDPLQTHQITATQAHQATVVHGNGARVQHSVSDPSRLQPEGQQIAGADDQGIGSGAVQECGVHQADVFGDHVQIGIVEPGNRERLQRALGAQLHGGGTRLRQVHRGVFNAHLGGVLEALGPALNGTTASAAEGAYHHQHQLGQGIGAGGWGTWWAWWNRRHIRIRGSTAIPTSPTSATAKTGNDIQGARRLLA